MVLFIVPATNPAPDTVHVMFEIAIVSVPLVRSLPASKVRVTAPEVLVLALAVMVNAPSEAAMLGTVSGSESGKVSVAALTVRVAVAETVAPMVMFFVAVTALSGWTMAKVATTTPRSRSFSLIRNPLGARPLRFGGGTHGCRPEVRRACPRRDPVPYGIRSDGCGATYRGHSAVRATGARP